MTISRRHMLAAGAAVAAIPSLPTASAFAQQAAPTAPSGQSPGWFRHKVGDITVTAIGDGFVQRPLEGFVRNASVADVQKALTDQGLSPAHIRVPYTSLVVSTGSRVILLDTGNGQFAPGANSGQWMSNFRAAGFTPEAVTDVVISHFHGDHINGLRNKDGEQVFKKAQVLAPEAEWAFWMDDARMNNAPDAMKGAFQNARRVFAPIKDVTRFDWDKEVVPGITSVRADGHSPGHTAFLIASGNARMMYVADITNTPILFARNPEWQVMFDMDAQKAIEARKRILDMASADKIRCAFYHGPFPAVGQVARDGAGYRLDMLPWQDAL
ncbi:MAG: MBL fold metallo-hydrolase [Beijerinckiaceae bacterium]|nr:MBL fold metallo-hydrolase [Beijerinckiaceae bacterium]